MRLQAPGGASLVVDSQHMSGGESPLAMVTFPDEIDTANARQLRGQLGSAVASAGMVIADLTATTFCDVSGARILLTAHEEAAAAGIELRLVVPSASVLRILALTGADTLLLIYPSFQDALQAESRAANMPHQPSSGL
jgi:anti-anti-sigma factor